MRQLKNIDKCYIKYNCITIGNVGLLLFFDQCPVHYIDLYNNNSLILHTLVPILNQKSISCVLGWKNESYTAIAAIQMWPSWPRDQVVSTRINEQFSQTAFCPDSQHLGRRLRGYWGQQNWTATQPPGWPSHLTWSRCHAQSFFRSLSR